MSDSTSILELPTEPAGGGNPMMSQNNISLLASELPSSNQAPSSITLDQSVISQIVSGIQQASTTGVTQLPSRDIPRSTESITHDPQVQPNYIPSSHQEKKIDYIPNNDQMNSIVDQYNREKNKHDSLDEIYMEIQGPLLLAVLYFLFQLPIFRKSIICYFPILFSKDGNYNIHGYLFMSVLFGLLYYLLTKISFYVTSFDM
jgi:hypothetical protein